jgi:GNAT superfamily N-acetyltransferase
LAAVQTLLGADGLPPKFFRRLINDLGADVYVAEDPGGAIVGLVSVAYARSLVRGGASALLDGVRAAREPAGPLLEGLIAFAEDRARRRGCRRLAAWVEPGDGALRAALLARGYQAGELLLTELGAAS